MYLDRISSGHTLLKGAVAALVGGIAVYQGLKVMQIPRNLIDIRLILAVNVVGVGLGIYHWRNKAEVLTQQVRKAQEQSSSDLKRIQELKNKEVAAEQLKKELTEVNRKCSELEQTRNEKEKSITSLKQQKEKDDAAIAQLIHEKKCVEDKLSKSEQANSTANTKLQETAQKVNQLTQQNDTLHSRIQAIHKEHEKEAKELKEKLTKVDQERARAAFANTLLQKEEVKTEEKLAIQPTEEGQSLIEYSISIVEQYPNEEDSHIVYVLEKDWAELIKKSPFFKAMGSHYELKPTIKGHSKEVISFTIRSLIGDADADCDLWEKKFQDPLLKAFLAANKFEIFGERHSQVVDPVNFLVNDYWKQALAHLIFALEVQDGNSGFLNFSTGSIDFWQERLNDLSGALDPEALNQLIGFCNVYCEQNYPLRILEDACLEKIVELKVIPAKPLQLSYLRVGRDTSSYLLSWSMSQLLNAEQLLKLRQTNCISLADTALVDFGYIEPKFQWSKSEKELLNGCLQEFPTLACLAYANHAEILMTSFKQKGFPQMFIMDFRDRFKLDIKLITDSLPKSEEWCWLPISLPEYGLRLCFFRVSDKEKCLKILIKYGVSHRFKEKNNPWPLDQLNKADVWK